MSLCSSERFCRPLQEIVRWWDNQHIKSIRKMMGHSAHQEYNKHDGKLSTSGDCPRHGTCRGARGSKGFQPWSEHRESICATRLCDKRMCCKTALLFLADFAHMWFMQVLKGRANCSQVLENVRYACNTRQHAATHGNTLQHTATHCNTRQHTATHGNSRQDTARHGKTLVKRGSECVYSLLSCWIVCVQSVFSCWIVPSHLLTRPRISCHTSYPLAWPVCACARRWCKRRIMCIASHLFFKNSLLSLLPWPGVCLHLHTHHVQEATHVHTHHL